MHTSTPSPSDIDFTATATRCLLRRGGSETLPSGGDAEIGSTRPWDFPSVNRCSPTTTCRIRPNPFIALQTRRIQSPIVICYRITCRIDRTTRRCGGLTQTSTGVTRRVKSLTETSTGVTRRVKSLTQTSTGVTRAVKSLTCPCIGLTVRLLHSSVKRLDLRVSLGCGRVTTPFHGLRQIKFSIPMDAVAGTIKKASLNKPAFKVKSN